MLLIGCDFSSAPTRRKPIVVALGESDASCSDVVRLTGFERFSSLDAWGEWLRDTPEWIGGFDFPFGLPRELVEDLGWPIDWAALIAHYASLSRAEIRESFAAFCAARPVGGKFAHRTTDGPAGSSPSMKWVNPPVAYMLHAGVPRLLLAGAMLPGLHDEAKNATRVALEAYPGLLARELIGRRSYKSDDIASQTEARSIARGDLLLAMQRGSGRLGVRMQCDEQALRSMRDDAKGDSIDSALCLIQAAWAAARRDTPGPGYALPFDMDRLEGWIVSA